MKNLDISIQVLKKYENQFEQIESCSEIIGLNRIEELRNKIKFLKSDAENAKNTDRLLRIGIIGQIKRGKSSFLNALLFNGDEVLPKAATPMTAALTAIKYSEEPKAIIEFYSEDEWQEIIDTAKSYDEFVKNTPYATVPEEFESCHQLVEMSKVMDISKYLGTKHEVKDTANVNELVSVLDDYVGAQGKFTPIVKYSELYLNIDTLRGLEIVDTPGLNDPISSRALRTKEFMGKCDVVFLLSACSQFLPEQDMVLLRQNIPSKGINNVLLIGSRLDNALQDVYNDYEDVETAISDLKRKYTRTAEKSIQKIKETKENEGLKIIEVLENALPPIFISAMFYNVAQHYENLNSEEKHNLDYYNKMFPNFTFNKELLYELSNISAVNEKLSTVKDKKKEILDERLQSLIDGFKVGYKNSVKETLEDTRHRYNKLLSADLAEITESYNNLIKKIRNGQTRVKNVFENNIMEIGRNFADLKLAIKEDAQLAKKIHSQKHTETESYEVSTSRWWNPFSWGRTETRHRTISYSYANTHEAIEQLEEFVLNSEKSLMKGIKEIVNISKFRNDVLFNIKDMFNFEDDDFDPQDIILPLEIAVKKITVPEYQLDASKRIEIIRGKFKSSKVKDDKIDQLRAEQAKVVELITQDIYDEISSVAKDISNKLEDTMNSFLPQLIEDLSITAESLKTQLNDKEESKKKYEEAISVLEKSI